MTKTRGGEEDSVSERRYNRWGGNPAGTAENPAHCIEAVWERGRGAQQYQCPRKRGSGPNGLYCGLHAKEHLDTPIGKWYATRTHGFEIEAVDVYSESATRIGIKQGGRVTQTNKRGYIDYWPTHKDAIEHLRKRVEQIKKEYEAAQRQFDALNR